MSLYDDPKQWAELAARLYDEKNEHKTGSLARSNLARRRGLPDPDEMDDAEEMAETLQDSTLQEASEVPTALMGEPTGPASLFDQDTRPLPDAEFDFASDVPANEFDDDDPTDVRIPGMERPRGTMDASIEPAPGECMAHLLNEDADPDAPAHPIPPECTEFTLGRGRDCELQVRVDGEISRRHARIVRRRDRFIIEDLNSRNGTLVNGELVESRRLFGGELIQVGLSRFRFVLLDA